MAPEHRPRRNNITTELSSDILFFHILPRLPVKSVLRCKCVSKQWHSFLTTPAFAKMHLNRVTNDDDDQNHDKLLVLSTSEATKFRTIDCETPKDGFTGRRCLPFQVSPDHNVWIVTSFHGMVCVAITKIRGWDVIEYPDLILWNPTTGEYKTLCKPSFRELGDETKGNQFELYYSSCDDDYRLVRLTNHPNPNVYIYSLKFDSWRKVESKTEGDSCPSVLLNENLYFIMGNRQSCSILKLNTKSEKFTEIVTPTFVTEKAYFLMLSVVKRCIELWVNYRNSFEMKLWRMEGGRDWKVVYSCRLSSAYQPLHYMRNGNLLMRSPFYYIVFGQNQKTDNCCLFEQNLKTDARDMICSYDKQDKICPKGKYVETMVSPNQYTIK